MTLINRNRKGLQKSGMLLLIALTFGATGCATNKYKDLQAFVQAHDHDVATSHYRIEPPDVIAISSPTSPEISGVSQQVASDGKITLKLLGEVKVSGLTPREAAAKLQTLLTKYYVSPKVNVRVAYHASKKYYVHGQVSGGGAMPFTGRDTVLDALVQAPPTFLAWGSQVKVIRPSAFPEERRVVVVDIDKMLKTGDTQKNFLLQEGDIIYVPPTPLAWVGLKIRELLFPVGPVLGAARLPAAVEQTTNYYSGRNNNGGNFGGNFGGNIGY